MFRRRRDSPARICHVGAFASLHVAFLLLYSLTASISAKGSSNWKTLSGQPPLIIARGGFSGLFPDSSSSAYDLAMLTSVPDVVLWCDVQLTKDGVGICSPDLRLENSTNISLMLKNKANTYVIDGVSTRGWFSVDFTWNELSNVILTQGIYTRSNKLDGNMLPIQSVEDMFALEKQGKGIWLNVQHNVFYMQHNKNMTSYIIDLCKRINVDYISSPDVTFLRSITEKTILNTTKLVFRLQRPRVIEPSTNQTYSSLLEDLPFIKSFASGILVPKAYIWPVDAALYLQPHTSLVMDAHSAGLKVFASDFYNDVPFSFNYSYDPVAEYLSFIDNGNFSVDGVLSDFPITASAARECFSRLDKNALDQVNVLVISKNGASGDYPSCTDKAYRKAIVDGANIIDCHVQISKDGIPFCLSSIDLKDSTTISQSNYSKLAKTIPEIKSDSGIYTFSLTWNQIRTLTPMISNPYQNFELPRNPKFKNFGKFLSLSDFLALAKSSNSLSGVLISIENAAYLLEKQQISVTDAVTYVLGKAGFENQTLKTVMIQSSNSSVLKKFKQNSKYKLVYRIDENIQEVDHAAIEEIKTFSDYVTVNKSSILTNNLLFLSGATDIVSKLKSAGLDVFVELFSNEFVSQAWDFFSDATIEINTYIQLANVSGLVTEFPLTAARYKKNKCLNLGKETPAYMRPIEPGRIMKVIQPQDLPPAQAPDPILTESDVVEPPLPFSPEGALVPTTAIGTMAPASSPAATTTQDIPQAEAPDLIITESDMVEPPLPSSPEGVLVPTITTGTMAPALSPFATTTQDLPPAQAPDLMLTESDVVEPPLPSNPDGALVPTTTTGTMAPAPSPAATTTPTPITAAATIVPTLSPTGTTIPTLSPFTTTTQTPSPTKTTPQALTPITAAATTMPAPSLAVTLVQTLSPTGMTMPTPASTTIVGNIIPTPSPTRAIAPAPKPKTTATTIVPTPSPARTNAPTPPLIGAMAPAPSLARTITPTPMPTITAGSSPPASSSIGSIAPAPSSIGTIAPTPTPMPSSAETALMTTATTPKPAPF